METKTFTTAHVLSTITGICMVPEPETYLPLVHFLLSHAAPDDLYTRAQAEFCVEQLKRQLPQFTQQSFQEEVAEFTQEFERVQDDRGLREACSFKWANKWIMRYGPTFEIMKPADTPPPPPAPLVTTYAYRDGNHLFVGRVIQA